MGSRSWFGAAAAVALGGAVSLGNDARADEGTHVEDAPEQVIPADYPRGTYVKVPEVPADLQVDTQPQQGGGAPHIIFLNRCTGGQTISPGWPDDSISNQSSIVQGVVNLPEFPFGDAAWASTLAETRAIYAPFNVQIVEQDPSPTPHDEAIVCGHGSNVGFGGAGGVAPFGCQEIPNAITYTFPESLGNNPRLLAEVVAQETAHAWTLDHEYLCEDPMTYLSGCGQKNFVDGDYPCGEFSQRNCECSGPTQNSYGHIMNLYGPSMPDMAPPTAEIVAPVDGDAFEPGADFDLVVDVSDDVAVAQVTVFLNGEESTADASEPFGPWPVVNVTEGDFEFYVEAVDLAGNVSMSNVVTVHVTPDGAPPPGDDDDDDDIPGDDDDDDDGGDGGGDGSGDDDDDDDGGDGGGDDGFDAEEEGSLPNGFGAARGDEGCACRAESGAGSFGMGLMVLGLLGLARRRRD